MRNSESKRWALSRSLSLCCCFGSLSLSLSLSVSRCVLVCEFAAGCGLYVCVLPVEGWLLLLGVNHCPCLDIQLDIYGGAAFSFLLIICCFCRRRRRCSISSFCSFRRQMLDPSPRHRVHHHQLCRLWPQQKCTWIFGLRLDLNFGFLPCSFCRISV